MSVFRDSILIGFSNIIVFIFSFFRSPILVRIFKFSPEIFGRFQYLMTILATISSYSQFSLDTAYISERKTHSVIERQFFFFWFSLIVISLTCISLFIWGIVSKSRLLFFQGIVLALPQILFSAISTNIRDEKRFDLLSLSRIINTFASTLIVIISAILIPDENSLIISTSISMVICFIFLAKKTKWNYTRIKLDKDYLTNFVKSNYGFILFQTGSSILNRFSFNSPIFFIKKLFDDKILGFYSLAHRLLLVTGDIWSSALSDVFLPYFSKSEEDERRIFHNFLLSSSVVFLLYFAVSALSDYYINILFGTEFMTVSSIIRILNPWLFSVIVVGPYTSAFLVHQKTGTNLFINIFLIGGRIGALLLGSIWSYKVSFIFFSVISVIFIDFMLILCFRYARISFYLALLTMILYQLSLFALIFRNPIRWFGYLSIILDCIILYQRRNMLKNYISKFGSLLKIRKFPE